MLLINEIRSIVSSSSIVQISQSHGGNWVTSHVAVLHAKIFFKKIDPVEEPNQTAFIHSVNKANRIGGTIGLIVSFLGAGGLVVTFYFTGSTLPLIAGLPFIPFIVAISCNSLINRLKPATEKEEIKAAEEPKPTTVPESKKEDTTIDVDLVNVLSQKSDEKVLEYARLIIELHKKNPDKPLANEIEYSFKQLFVESIEPKKALYLNNNLMDSYLIKQLLNALSKDTYYDIIDLSGCSIKDQNAEDLAALIKKKSFKELNLHSNSITEKGFETIITRIKGVSISLDYLNLSHNSIDLTYEALKNLFAMNIGIKKISLEKNPTDKLVLHAHKPSGSSIDAESEFTMNGTTFTFGVQAI